MKKNPAAVSQIMLVCSMLTFGSIGIFRRLIPLSSAVLAGFRGIAGALFLLLFMCATGRKHQKIQPGKLIGLMLAGAGIGINWVLLFEAYRYTTVATATLCYYMEPTLVILLSPLIFKESLSAKKLICVAVALIGMIFVAGRSNGSAAGSLQGILFGLGAACFYAAVVITNKICSGVDVYEKTTIQLVCAALVVLPYIFLTEDLSSVSLDPTSIIMLLVVGIVHTGVAYTMYFGSMDALPVQSVAILSYLDPIAAMILSAVVLG